MMVDKATGQSSLYRAATTAFDFNNPAESLAELLRLVAEMLSANSAALYEFDEAHSGFTPRFAHGISVGELGRLSATSENAVLRSVLSDHRAAVTKETRSSLGLPLGPGIVACAPCLTGGQTIGLIFASTLNGDGFCASGRGPRLRPADCGAELSLPQTLAALSGEPRHQRHA
jgi:hypothetical protein